MSKKASKKSSAKYRSVVARSGKQTVPLFNYSTFKLNNTRYVFIGAIILALLFSIELFKNISYPLFWADESATVVGSGRVLQFGYPKVHDGKNVFYDLRHADPQLGIDKKTDAYIGGSGWGQFYFGTIGYKLSELTSDIYAKTGIFRITFAMAGLAGILFMLWFVSKFLNGKFSKYSFVALFFLLELCSVSLMMVLKQVRYYSLSLLLVALITGLYSLHRFYKPIKNLALIPALVILLWALFNTFAPVYFLLLVTLMISEMITGVIKFVQVDLKEAIRTVWPVALSLLISFFTIWPLLLYLKTFEIAEAMATFNGYNHKMYLFNLNTVFTYFKNFDFLWLAVALKALILLHIKKHVIVNSALFKLSSFLTLFFIIYVLGIAQIPNFTFTRYFIPVQPIFTVIILIDLFLLINLFSSKSTQLFSIRTFSTITMFALFLVIGFIRNLDHIQGYVHEISEQYKGPLDYTIPYIQDHYKRTERLTIATNYEETSFMYYLKSKVIIGYVGNNLAQDSMLVPDIIIYRKPWGNFTGIFNKFVQQSSYNLIRFPVKDQTCNTIPELNFPTPYFNHQFYNVLPENEHDSSEMLFK